MWWHWGEKKNFSELVEQLRLKCGLQTSSLTLPGLEQHLYFSDKKKNLLINAALRTSRLEPPGNIPGTQCCYRLNRPQGHSAVGRNKSMKYSCDSIGDRTRDLPACSTVPRTTAPSRAPLPPPPNTWKKDALSERS